MDDVLKTHRERVAALEEAMRTLEHMHDEAYALWARIVKIDASEGPERRAELDALHDESYALAERIARLREETFGAIDREARLRLTSSVESAPPTLTAAVALPLHED